MNANVKEIEEVAVSLGVVWQGKAGRFDARLSEISMDGCFIGSLGQETLGEIISFNVNLIPGIWVTLHGEVICQEYPIGFQVRFTDLTPRNRKLVTQVIAAHGGRQVSQTSDEENISAHIPRKLRRVLVADDEPMTLRMLTVVIEEMGFEVVSATDGREAFRTLQQDSKFCAAMFDMNMPHLYGMDLIYFMKTDDRLRHIPIGMVTSEQDPKIWNESFSAGAKMFVAKPFLPSQIKMTLRLLIGKN